MNQPNCSIRHLAIWAAGFSLICSSAGAAPQHIGFLSPQVSHAFQEYLSERTDDGFKLFMVASDGTFAWSARSSFEAAFDTAREKCNELRNPWKCDLYAVGDTIVWGMPEKDRVAIIAGYRERSGQETRPAVALPPPASTIEGEKAFLEYRDWDEGPNLFKVFALSKSGAWSWSTRFSYEAAERDAIAHCEEAPGSRRGLCRPYAIGNTVVWTMPETSVRSVISTYQISRTALGPPATEAPLGVRTLQAFRAYQTSADFKFFAIGGGSWGTSNRDSFELALEETMSVCRQYAGRPCELFAVGNTVVWGASEEIRKQVMDTYRQRK